MLTDQPCCQFRRRCSFHDGLHEAAQVGVIVPDEHLRDDARVGIGRGGALRDQPLERVAAARQDGI